MVMSREASNPLRPYYVPPSIGEHPVLSSIPSTSTTARSASTSSPSSLGSAVHKSHDLLSDLEYRSKKALGGSGSGSIVGGGGHVIDDDGTPSISGTVKDLLDDLLWKYSSVLMAQPFRVAKTVLQVYNPDPLGILAASASNTSSSNHYRSPSAANAGTSSSSTLSARPKSTASSVALYPDTLYENAFRSDDEEDEASLFSSHGNLSRSSTTFSRGVRPHSTSVTSAPPSPPAAGLPLTPSLADPHAAALAEAPATLPHQLSLSQGSSVRQVLQQLWQKESVWGVWKGSNATFLYTVLQSLLENWSRSLLCALFNVPDLAVRDDIDRLVEIASPYPLASLCVAATAAAATGLILAPLDMLRTGLMLMPSSARSSSRRTIPMLRSLPSYFCPSLLVVPTMLHAMVHPVVTLSTPLLLRSQFRVDADASPFVFSLAKFCASATSTFVRLPLETVLRRGQLAVLSTADYARVLTGQTAARTLETVVPIGEYHGVTGTMMHIVQEEGVRTILPGPAALPVTTAPYGRKPYAPERIKGQGLEGLWQGWKVSWWGMVGLWAASALSRSSEGEF